MDSEGLPDRIAREAKADHPVVLLHEPELNSIRGATAPKRNTFSNANRTREPAIAEKLYWDVFRHLQAICPSFTQYRRHRGFIFRVKRGIFASDSTTLKLSLDCIDWARHRRKKAAAKTHMRLNVGSMLPTFAIVEDAANHDSKRTDALCDGMKDGDVLVAERAYVDLLFLHGLATRGVFFVLREKENMTFITNNFGWSPRTIAELYRARWAIESFFKEFNQTLQLADFVGYNEKAVKWQVWIGLLAHLLLRFFKHVSKWGLGFSRLAGTVRSALWMKIDLLGILRIYGTAGGSRRPVIVDKQLYFQGFEPFSHAPAG